MSVSTLLRKNMYNGDGVSFTFPYTFKCPKAENLKIVKIDENEGHTEILYDDEKVTITGINEDNGGNVIYPNDEDPDLIIQTGERILIYREADKTQESEFERNEPFNPKEIERILDKLVMRDQEQDETLSRCLKSDIGSTAETFDEYIDIIENTVIQTEEIKNETQVINNSTQTIYENTQELYENIHDIYDVMPPLPEAIDAGKIPIVASDGGSYELINNDAPNYIYIDGTVVDWALGRYFSKVLTANTVLTFDNISNYSKEINITIIEPNTGSYSLTWPAGIRWDGGSAPTQTANATDLYQFFSINGIVYGKRVCANMDVSAFPYGIEGNLTINNGEVVEVAAGSIKDYNNLTINTGGILRITGNSKDFTQIGVAGNLILAGTIEAKNNTTVGATSTVTGDGTVLSHTLVQKNGGAGGAGGNASINSTGGRTGGSGQSSSNGEGGGGGSGAQQNEAFVKTSFGTSPSWTRTDTVSAGSNNGLSPSVNGTASCSSNGSGGYITTTTNSGGGTTRYCTTIRYNGGHCVSAAGTWVRTGYLPGSGSSRYCISSGGGGGGAKGLHGKNLYIRVKGTFDGTGGTIDCSGNNGGAGGSTENASSPNADDSSKKIAIAGSGGGGGGAGGSAGKVVIRHANGTYTAPTINVTGGTAGGGGTGSNGWKQATAHSVSNGVNGTAGTAGDNGVVDAAVYV